MRGSFFLELFNLCPDGIRNIVVRSNRVKGLWETVLLEEVYHLVVLLRYLGELGLDFGLQYVLELILHTSDRRWNQVSEFLIKIWGLVQFFSHTNKVDEVLWVCLGTFRRVKVAFVVDLLVVVFCFGMKFCGFLDFLIKVGLIGATENIYEGTSLFEFLQCKLAISCSQIHAFSRLTSGIILGNGHVQVGLGQEVLGVVSEDIGELAILIGSELLIHLIAFKRLLEVHGYLGSNLCEDLRSHACITGLFEEEVLGLSEAQVAIHSEGFFGEVSGRLSCRKLSDRRE